MKISMMKRCVVIESSSVWYNIYSYLSKEKHLNVILSNPVKTRAIASAKGGLTTSGVETI
jgi:hypothetical protein